jgi:hypothetical protein
MEGLAKTIRVPNFQELKLIEAARLLIVAFVQLDKTMEVIRTCFVKPGFGAKPYKHLITARTDRKDRATSTMMRTILSALKWAKA